MPQTPAASNTTGYSRQFGLKQCHGAVKCQQSQAQHVYGHWHHVRKANLNKYVDRPHYSMILLFLGQFLYGPLAICH